LIPTGLAPLYERSSSSSRSPSASPPHLDATARSSLVHARTTDGLVQLLAYALAPALGRTNPGRMIAADRWSYLPAIPLSLLAAAALSRVLDARALRAAAAVLVLMLAVLTRLQLPVWSSDTALWSRAVAASPLSSFALERLAAAAAAAGRPGDADGRRAHARTVRRSSPISPSASERSRRGNFFAPSIVWCGGT
jgi:hypothetical protein